MGNKKDFIEGLKSGIPIGLGYLSVSFAFGIMCIESGLYWWQALIISMTTLTSAGQLAGLGIMVLPHMYIEMLVNQLTINVRYSFMSISLSQKTDSKFKGIFKWLLGFFITDEIFGVAVSKKSVSRSFFFGLGLAPYFGWAIGTLIGALLGQVFPDVVMNALSIAMYGMFIAIIVPPCKGDIKTLFVVAIAAILSCIIYFIPVFNNFFGTLAISVSAVLSALIGAIAFPRKEGIEDGC
jgi:predicted branched-subunit amino acid permease